MSYIENARLLRPIIEQAVQSLDDESALTAVTLYPQWAADTDYKAGFKAQRNGILYRCLQDHKALTGWEPENAPSLWAKVLIPDPGVIPAWEQPDSTNAYSKGDKVTHKGKTWVSTVDNNVWEPGVYGWDEI